MELIKGSQMFSLDAVCSAMGVSTVFLSHPKSGYGEGKNIILRPKERSFRGPFRQLTLCRAHSIPRFDPVSWSWQRKDGCTSSGVNETAE